MATPRTAKDELADSWEAPKSNDERLKHHEAKQKFLNQKSSVYDVPDSGEDELSTPVVTPRRRRRRPSAPSTAGDEVNGAQSANADDSGKKRRGRPGKRDRDAHAKAQKELFSDAPTSPSAQQLEAETVEAHDEAPIKNSSVSKARYSKAVTNGRLEEDAQVPKGILTPRKGRNVANHQRKSVAFDSEADPEALDELAAVTPSTSHRKPRQEAPKEAADEMDVDGKPEANEEVSEDGSGDDEEDDEVCAICSKPDSEAPNEIIFCDNCDMAVHQECYGVTEIPEGDWICRNCSQEGVSALNGVGAQLSTVTLAEEKPDIPNFDHHLRSMQRVLLDRCAGRRRIKLRGQDEAYRKTSQLVEQTIVAGEGNSMMVIGARGCGKTTVSCPLVSTMP